MLFCPTCANLLMVDEGPETALRYSCNTCPYMYNIKKTVSSRTFPKLKELDYIMGGAAAWENVDSTDAVCPKCSHGKALDLCSKCVVRYKSAPKMKIKMTPVIPCAEIMSPAKAAKYLANGQVIAVPTDTIYGLACSANCPDAIQKLYTIKGRDSGKPVAICVTSILDVRKWGEATHLTDSLLSNLLPGPVTVVLERSKLLDNPYLNPTTTKIGIRIPKHSFMNTFTKIFDMPVALTSANFSNEPSTLSIKEFEHLSVHLGAVFDGGLLNHGQDQSRSGSTVIDLSDVGFYNVIRKGTSFEKVVGIVESYGLKSFV
ncbi:Ischemia/reperfusion inducible protein [Operophtera brumata]|uniref:Threonylcarbamoyl-AMP synthase n=1 Tax=Operophtera brumata TaxID=104452 RepID=A0A0L7LTN2_OPEBR|nr:Ischemia/reperfusion inducible protein [Operophtera brumata]